MNNKTIQIGISDLAYEHLVMEYKEDKANIPFMKETGSVEFSSGNPSYKADENSYQFKEWMRRKINIALQCESNYISLLKHISVNKANQLFPHPVIEGLFNE